MIVDLWAAVITSSDIKSVADSRAKTQEVNDARWTKAANNLLLVCQLLDDTSLQSVKVNTSIAATVTRQLDSLAMNTSSRPVRLAFFKRLDLWLRMPRPAIGPDHTMYQPELL
jgi:hypothetical protein